MDRLQQRTYNMDPNKECGKDLQTDPVKNLGFYPRLGHVDGQCNGKATPSGIGSVVPLPDIENGAGGSSEVVENQEERSKEPLKYAKVIVRHPYLTFGVTLFAHILMIGVSVVLQVQGYDVFPADFQQIPIDLTGEPVTLKSWAWNFRNSRDVISRVPFTGGKVWERMLPRDPLQVMYTHKGENVFNKETLKNIQKIENEMSKNPEYRDKFCQVDKQRLCIKPTSIINYFDGSYSHISKVFNDTGFSNIPAVIWEAYTNPITRSSFVFFLGNKSVITPDNAFSETTRSLFLLGYPINNVSDWHGTVGEFVFYRFAPEFIRTQRHIDKDVQVSPLSWSMFVTGAAVYGVRDVFLILGSLVFIFILIWVQTSSFWVTFWAVFSIVASFFGTNLIYRFLLDFRYFSYFHLMGMFIILGIGADDIFVFFNTWKATGFQKYPSLEHRLSDCYRRASVSMFVTSFTTMVAFFVTSLSPLLAARSFGLFTGFLVIINYISVVVFFPTVIVIYHHAFEGRDIYGQCLAAILRCKKCKKKDMDSGEYCEDDSQPGTVVRFFEGPYFRLVSHKIGRWVLLAVFVVLTVTLSACTSLLRPDSEQVMIFKESTVLGRGWSLFFNAFQVTDQSRLKNNLVWGMLPRNISNCHFSDYNCKGRTAWDERFDINLPEVQIAMKDFCWRLKYNMTEEEAERLHIRRDPRTRVADVHCFMENMGRFLKSEAARLSKMFNRTVDLSFPLTERKVRPFMKLLSPYVYNVSALLPSFHRYFEVALSYWLTNRYTMIPTNDFKMFNGYLGEGRDGANTRLVEFFNTNKTAGMTNLPMYGTRLRYAGIPINLTDNFFGLGYSTGLPVYRAWDAYLAQKMPTLPYQLRGAFQANTNQWHWLFVQETVVQSAMMGIGLGIGLALPVLILATMNIILGTVSTLIITAIAACVIGVIPLAGWKLGLLVSVNLCLVVGLSVDYVVHMSEGYHMSKFKDREAKVKDTLGKMGVSIISGAATTLGASFFMFFGHTQFFLQFAAFMFSTIGFAALLSLGVFPVVMVIFGPEGDTGSLIPVFCWGKNRFIGRTRTDVDCLGCDGKGFVAAHPENASFSGAATSNANRRDVVLPSYSNPCFQEDVPEREVEGAAVGSLH